MFVSEYFGLGDELSTGATVPFLCLKTEKQAPKFLDAEWGKRRTAENGDGLCCFTSDVL